MHGVVLTHTDDLKRLTLEMRGADLGVLKIVTAWGCDWSNPQNRALAASVPSIIIRSEVGDGIKPPDPNRLRDEIKPWYKTRQNIIIEIGNEPNAAPNITDQLIWQYRAVTDACITMIRSEFPYAQIISPALITGNNLQRWYAICFDVWNKCDYIGIHAYEWHSFITPGTYQLTTAIHTARRNCTKPMYITELGINDAATSAELKAGRYRQAIATLPGDVAGTVCYHICDKPIDADQRAYALPVTALRFLR